MVNVTTLRRFVRRQSFREALAAYFGLLPWLLGFVIFTAGPIIATFGFSFTEYNILQPPKFIGLGNFERMSLDPLIWKSLTITFMYTLISVTMVVTVGFSTALLLNREIPGLSFWRTAYFLPSIVPSLATAFIFSFVFNAELGVLNMALRTMGIEGPKWFNSTAWVLPSFIMIALWGSGYGLPIYLSALQGVPRDLYDAAKVDGANAWQRFWNVTLPQTSPVVFFMFLTGIIGSFQVFTAAYIITDGGPNNASLFYVLYLYRSGWKFLEMGYAAAMAVVLFAVIMAATVAALVLGQRRVFYEGG